MKVLKSRLYDLKLKEQQAKLEQISGEKKDIAFGSQIRSYVLHPYQMIKDHRTKDQVGDINRVLTMATSTVHQELSNEEGVRDVERGGGRRRLRCLPAVARGKARPQQGVAPVTVGEPRAGRPLSR